MNKVKLFLSTTNRWSLSMASSNLYYMLVRTNQNTIRMLYSIQQSSPKDKIEVRRMKKAGTSPNSKGDSCCDSDRERLFVRIVFSLI